MKYAIVAYPAAPVRRKPAHSAEMVNQLLFGESVRVVKSKKDYWMKVRSLHDDYEGWVTSSLLQPIDKRSATTKTKYTTTDILSTINVGDDKMNIPAGSSLPFFNEGIGTIGSTSYTYQGHYFNLDEQQPGAALLQQLTQAWLNAPYLWGGRTPLGVDCSGFVQVIYKLMGIELPRDAWQQAQEGTSVKKFAEVQPGDLAFFDNKEEIVHVGILLGNERIIHASGKVKIDQISDKGILDKSTGKLSNKLRAIRRFW